MSRTITVNFGWNTIREQYSLKCNECGGSFLRIESTGYNDMASDEYRKKKAEDLKERAKNLSQTKDFACDACRRAKITVPSKIEITDLIGYNPFGGMADIIEDQKNLNCRIQSINADTRKLKDYIFIYKSDEYVCTYAEYCMYDNAFTVSGYRIHKRKPWDYTENQVQAPIDEVVFLNETLKSRKEAAAL